jgi:S1-C subfamily serine protease
VLSGARAGTVLFFGGDAVTVGRHPDSDIQFHPQQDLAVSTHHALLFCRAGLWHVRDLSSRNGTYVNQIRITADRPLVPGNRILFGHGGPEVEFRYAPLVTPSVEMAVMAKQAGDLRPPGSLLDSPSGSAPRSPSPPHREGTAERLRVQLTREASRLRWAAIGLSLLLVALAVAFYSVARDRSPVPEGEVERLQGQMDALLQRPVEAADNTPVEVAGLDRAIQEARTGVEGAREQLRGPATSPAPEPMGLTPPVQGGEEPPEDPPGGEPDPMEVAREAIARYEAASTMDFQAVAGLNRRAVVRLYVEMPDGEVITGTAFAVRPNGTLVTNRHVLVGDDGTQPLRVGAQFADSEQVWPVRILILSPNADLALVKVDNIVGDVPVVSGFNLRPDTLAPGTPLALLGFPLGGELPLAGERGGTVVRPLLSAGALEAAGPDELVIQGYGATGASGSPVLDASGAVVGIVFGGRGQGEQHRLLAVPSPQLRRLLDALPDLSTR